MNSLPTRLFNLISDGVSPAPRVPTDVGDAPAGEETAQQQGHHQGQGGAGVPVWLQTLQGLANLLTAHHG